MIKTGRYQHYKGGIYIVLLVAQEANTGQPIVIYMNEEHGTYYTRGLGDFVSDVAVDTSSMPRFKLIEDKP